MTGKEILAMLAVILLATIKREEIDHAEIKYSNFLFQNIFWFVGNYFASAYWFWFVDSKCNGFKETNP